MKSVTASFSRIVPKLQVTRSMPDNRSNPGVPPLQALPLLVPLLPIRSTSSTSANRSPTSRPSKGGFRINLREDKVVAKWLDKLKAVFVKAPVEIESPVEVFVPKVGQLMMNEFQIHSLLASKFVPMRHKQGRQYEVWNPKKQKAQIIRSKPMVAVDFFSLQSEVAHITLYGNKMAIEASRLQFK